LKNSNWLSLLLTWFNIFILEAYCNIPFDPGVGPAIIMAISPTKGGSSVKKLFVATIILMAGALAGCSSMNMSSNSMPLTAPIDTNVKADIQVGEKITGQSSVTKVLFFTLGADKEYADGVAYGGSGGSSFPFGDPIGDAKAAAAYKAVKASGADVIVLPRYTVKTQDYLIFSKIDVTVEGYKGIIKSVK
jgi:hypothetical protein